MRFLSSKQRFTEVYRTGEWNLGVPSAPKSGIGSTIDATVGVRANLFSVVARLFAGQSTLRIVDAPCGDMTWMPLALNALAAQFEHVDYIGLDIVESVINENRRLSGFAKNVSVRFEVRDVTREPIPGCDLVFCKDLVNHLFNRDVARLLRNLNRSGAKFAMITSNRGWENVELPVANAGATRHLDLEGPPFRLPLPLEHDGYLALWALPFDGFDPEPTREPGPTPRSAAMQRE